MTSIHIPKKDEEITVSFLKKIGGDFCQSLQKIKIFPTATHGQMSQTRKIELSFDDGGNQRRTHMIFKYCGEEKVRMAVNIDGIFHRNEVHFYQNFVEKTPNKFVSTPRIFAIGVEKRISAKFFFLMEDCAPKMFKTEEENDSLKVVAKFEVVDAVMKEIARLHSCFWIHNPGKRKFVGLFSSTCRNHVYESIESPNEKLCSPLFEDFSFVYHTRLSGKLKKGKTDDETSQWAAFGEKTLSEISEFFEGNWKLSLPILKKECKEGNDEDFSRFKATIDGMSLNGGDLISRLFREGYRSMVLEDDLTVRHGDFRFDNLSYDKESGVVKIYDWQCVAIGNGLIDVASFLVTSCDCRTLDVKKVISSYYETLSKKLIEKSKKNKLQYNMKSLSKCIEYFKRAFFYQVLGMVQIVPVLPMYKDKEGMKKVYQGLKRHVINVLVIFTQFFKKELGIIK